MDTEQLIAHGRARFEHAAARRLLREKYQAKLTFAHAGGMWRAAPETITLLSLYDDQSIVIQDLYENPVRINAKELYDIMRSRWQEQMTAWLIEYDQLSKNR
jgi:hypothetical protein